MEMHLSAPGKLHSAGVIQLSDEVFSQKFNESLVHQVVVAYLAGGRAGTRAQKTRAEVRGGGKKPWRQKGTGRARAGSIRSPIWVGGGRAFAAKPQDFSQKVNKKMYKAAIRSILSELMRTDRLVIVEQISLDAPKTKSLLTYLNALELKKVLIVVELIEENLYLASRNLYQVELKVRSNIDPVSLINFDKVLITVDALKKIEESLI